MKLMQVAPSGGNICNECRWRHLVVKFAINASGAIWWPNLQLKCKCCHLVVKFATDEVGAIWWPNLQLMQVLPSGGQICSNRPGKKVPQSARLSAGGGSNRYLGNAQIEVTLTSKVLPLCVAQSLKHSAFSTVLLAQCYSTVLIAQCLIVAQCLCVA